MESRRNLIKTFLIIVVIGILFAIGWLLGKNNLFFFEKLPLTGEPDKKISIDSSTLDPATPWNVNVSRTKPDQAPVEEELHQVFLGLMKSVEERDVIAFSKYASSKLYWILMQNAKMIAINDNDMIISQTGDLTGADYFTKYAPARFRYSIPWEPQYYKISRIEAVTLAADEDYILNDKSSGANTLIKDITYENAYRAFYNIEGYPYINRDLLKPEGGYAEDGFIEFVFENGTWKVQSQNWQTSFLGEFLIDADDIHISANSAIKQLNPASAQSDLENISIKTEDIVRWDLFSGVILSTDTNAGSIPWNSPLLSANSYQRSFAVPGVYSYAIINNDNEIHGQITVTD